MAEFETGGVYLSGLVRSIDRQGHGPAFRAAAGADLSATLDALGTRKWWPTSTVLPFMDAFAALKSPDVIRSAARDVMFNSISNIVRPLISVLGSLGGVTPRTFFSRYPQLTQSAIKGLEFEWNERGPTEAQLVVIYPMPVRREFGLLWEGAFDFTFEISHVRGTNPSSQHQGGRFSFDLRWTRA